MFSFEEVKKRVSIVIIVPRVSDPGQKEGTSLEAQEKELYPKAQALEPDDIIVLQQGAESAQAMDRDQINECKTLIQSHEPSVVVKASVTDRLSRADPLLASEFLLWLRRNNAILYLGDKGYLDLHDVEDEEWVLKMIVWSRMERDKIVTRSRNGENSKLKAGKIHKSFYGVGRDDDGWPVLNEAELDVMKKMGVLWYDWKTGHIPTHKAIIEILKNEHDTTIIPAESSIRPLLTRDTYRTGVVNHNGEDIGLIPELRDRQIFSDRVYEAIHSHYIGRKGWKKSKRVFDDVILSLIDEFGLVGTHRIIERFLLSKCPNCGEPRRTHGWRKVRGRLVRNYNCQACGRTSPIFSEHLLKEFVFNSQITCPDCRSVVSDTAWTERYWGENPTEQEWFTTSCRTCGFRLGVSKSDLHRANRKSQSPNQGFDPFKYNDE